MGEGDRKCLNEAAGPPTSQGTMSVRKRGARTGAHASVRNSDGAHGEDDDLHIEHTKVVQQILDWVRTASRESWSLDRSSYVELRWARSGYVQIRPGGVTAAHLQPSAAAS